MFDLIFICDERKLFEGPVTEVQFITANAGPITIFTNHQPYMAKIAGNISYITANGEQKVADIEEGFVYTNGTVCHIVADLTHLV
jgi:F0F1-type ATP synthase epsilon subunit